MSIAERLKTNLRDPSFWLASAGYASCLWLFLLQPLGMPFREDYHVYAYSQLQCCILLSSITVLFCLALLRARVAALLLGACSFGIFWLYGFSMPYTFRWDPLAIRLIIWAFSLFLIAALAKAVGTESILKANLRSPSFYPVAVAYALCWLSLAWPYSVVYGWRRGPIYFPPDMSWTRYSEISYGYEGLGLLLLLGVTVAISIALRMRDKPHVRAPLFGACAAWAFFFIWVTWDTQQWMRHYAMIHHYQYPILDLLNPIFCVFLIAVLVEVAVGAYPKLSEQYLRSWRKR
jgi:hypothetical protein